MQSNQRQLALGLLLVVIVGATGYYYYARSGGLPAPGNTITLQGVCLACQQDVTTTYAATERQPAGCPRCKKRAVYGTFYCAACQLRFVPNLEPAPAGEPPRMPMIARCPVCGSDTVAGCMSLGPAEQQAKLAPLPTWKD